MSHGRAIQINDKGVRPMLDPPCNIHVPKESLEELQFALAAHIVTRPDNLDPALPAWVERKEELKRGIDLHRAALPPKVVIVQAPPKPKQEVRHADGGGKAAPPPSPATTRTQDPPMPRPRLSPEEKHAKKLEYQRRHRAKVKAAAGDVSKKPRKVRTSVERVAGEPVIVRVTHTAHTADDELHVRLRGLQCDVLAVLSYVVPLEPADRAAYLEAAANLDALAHQLAQFLATGRIEVAA